MKRPPQFIRIVIQGTSLLTAGELFNLALDIVPQVLAILVILPIRSAPYYMHGVYFKEASIKQNT